MFAFFRKFFRRSTRTTPVPTSNTPPAPIVQISSADTSVKKSRAPIPYKSNLTERLRADHQELLAIHGNVLEAAQRGDCKTLDNRIRDFETGLKAHLSEEFRDLYVFTEYLANQHKSEQDRTQLRDFKQEMQIIGGQVMGILNKYNKEPIKDQQIPGIIADFTQMGGILADRIRREEATLYPMYDDYGARYEKNSSAGMSASPIHYRADLTIKLKDEHQQLLAIHGAVLQAAEQHNYEQINKSLKEFEQGLKSHLAEEFRDLYIYLEFLAKDRGANDDRQRLRDFKQEMQVIGGQVMGILNKYSKTSINRSAIPGLIADFTAMGNILVDRIQREESILYPMYDVYGINEQDTQFAIAS